jgi:hypothetical protein
MLGMEGPKHLRDRAALVDELVNRILKVLLAFSMVEKLYPYPGTEESRVCGSEFDVGHDFVLPHPIIASLSEKWKGQRNFSGYATSEALANVLSAIFVGVGLFSLLSGGCRLNFEKVPHRVERRLSCGSF